MCGVSLKDRKRSVDLYSLLGIQSVAEVVSRIDGGAYEARRHVPPQNFGAGGTLCVPPQILGTGVASYSSYNSVYCL